MEKTNFELKKVPMYVSGLDQILCDGVPEGRTTVIEGGPGCGKSIMAMEFIYRGALAKQPGMIVNFEEPENCVRENCLTLGWDLEKLEAENLVFLHAVRTKPISHTGGDFDLGAFKSIIENQAKNMKARRIVLDAIDVLLRNFKDRSKQEEMLYDIHGWLKESGYTTIITVKAWQRGRVGAVDPEIVDYLTDCLIFLDRRVKNQVATRRLRVEKYRGSNFLTNEHPFVIGEKGILVMPVSQTRFRDRGLGERLGSGCDELDLALGGGYRRYACILVAGSTGAGKSSIAALFAKTRCDKSERVLYISFEESEPEIVNNMKSVSIDLEPHVTEGRLLFSTSMPESKGAEEHLIGAIHTIESFNPEHVIIDAISACQRMGTERAAFDFVIRLVSYCKEHNVTVMLLNQTTNTETLEELSGTDVSSTIDSIIRLSLVERSGEINRILTVMKSRGSQHSNQFREFHLTSEGISLKEVYVGSGKVLTGVERQIQEEQDSRDLMRVERKKQRLLAEMQVLQSELDNMDLDIKLSQNGIKQRTEMRT